MSIEMPSDPLGLLLSLLPPPQPVFGIGVGSIEFGLGAGGSSVGLGSIGLG
ncbi:hypothetical protein ACFWPA_18955 [Rhodococcus sp. NPDC058505]|uniref:hypothetical protein n=1 Tax=unclassified Rhodococcus (in: high G+C Gram-positive bacteria) TaxID=192944 RepID=UPI00364CC36C